MNEVAILGCGISGMLVALRLSKNNIQSTIIEQKSHEVLSAPSDMRTTALNASSKQFIEKIGLWDLISSRAQEIRHIYVCQNMSESMLHMESDEEPLGYMITNKDLRKILYNQILQDENIKIFTSKPYSSVKSLNHFVDIGFESDALEERLRCKLCIVADGKFSEVRNTHFTNRLVKNYKQTAIVFNISHSIQHKSGAIEHFLPRGTFATLPLTQENESAVVWVEENGVADFYMSRDKDALCKIIYEFTGGSLGEIKIITPLESYPLDASVTSRYFSGRIALVSDSAHNMHPLAGQGLNMGIKDIDSLTSLVSEYENLGLEYDETMLVEYERQRKMDNMNMIRITDSMNTIFTYDSCILNFFTQKTLGIIDQLPFVKNLLVSYARGDRA